MWRVSSLVRSDRYEAVKKLGQAPSRPLIFQGFRRFRSEPVPFFHSLVMRGGALDKPAPVLRLTRYGIFPYASDCHRIGGTHA
jgi:hypothetical protein